MVHTDPPKARNNYDKFARLEALAASVCALDIPFVVMLRHNVLRRQVSELTAHLGDHKTFKHILRKQCEVLWIWGPVTQFSINLKGVDSAGSGGGDVMELIGRLGARRETTELLLDSFMQGFVHELFLSKWRRFAGSIYYVRRRGTHTVHALTTAAMCTLLTQCRALCLLQVAERRQLQQAREKAAVEVQRALEPEGLFARVEPTAHIQCTQSPLHSCTLLTVACALCVWYRCSAAGATSRVATRGPTYSTSQASP